MKIGFIGLGNMGSGQTAGRRSTSQFLERPRSLHVPLCPNSGQAEMNV